MNCIAIINTNNLKDNFLNIRKKVGNSKVMAMVKANAYGHGVKEVIQVLESIDNSPDYYGVAFLNEALEIQNLSDKPILVTEPLSREEIEIYIEKATEKIIPVLSSEEGLKLLENFITKPTKIHIKVNSGMNRLGIRKEKAVEFIKNVLVSDKFIIDGTYTHFATSDEKDKTFANKQLGVFKEIISNFNREDLGLIHTANSGAILDMPESYFDMVRSGILLYGYYPSLETSEFIEVKPVMSLYSYISEVTYVEEGESVGYGARYSANEKHQIASISMGYADGIRRGLSGKIDVIIDGNLYKQIGTISMDRFSISLDDNNFEFGQKVTLIGKEGKNKIDFWNWAKILNTIPYEIMCGIGNRFERKFRP